jgi:hypothetical protein
VDACGYPGEWGTCGEGDPTNPAEAAISMEAEDAIRAEKAENDGVQAEIALSADVWEPGDPPAESTNPLGLEPKDEPLVSEDNDRWWEWI